MLNHTSIEACFEHFDLLTVNDLNCKMINPIKDNHTLQKYSMIRAHRHATYSKLGQVHEDHKFDYEPFNCNNVSIRYWSWYYRGCWHQTCPPMDPR